MLKLGWRRNKNLYTRHMTAHTNTSTHIGPAMEAVLRMVRQQPGQYTMLDVARIVGPNRSLKYGYRTVHRCLDRGLIRIVPDTSRPRSHGTLHTQ